ncbi:MAG: hypothetical protein ACLGH3_02815 [Actinomycetota bacterium]
MKAGIVIALIAAFPSTLAAVLGYLASIRSIRRSVGATPGMPLSRALERLDAEVDRLIEGQAVVRERLARLEGIATSENKERSA